MFESTFSILLSAISGCQPNPSTTAWQMDDGPSSYVSAETGRGGIRSLIYVKGQNFNLRAVGADAGVGQGSHEGGLITLDDHGTHFRLSLLGIIIPKTNVSNFEAGELSCHLSKIDEHLSRTVCTDSSNSRAMSYVISRDNEVISFTGLCYINAARLCNYVLVSPSGIKLEKVP